jgi:hypothetical protein
VSVYFKKYLHLNLHYATVQLCTLYTAQSQKLLAILSSSSSSCYAVVIQYRPVGSTWMHGIAIVAAFTSAVAAQMLLSEYAIFIMKCL